MRWTFNEHEEIRNNVYVMNFSLETNIMKQDGPTNQYYYMQMLDEWHTYNIHTIGNMHSPDSGKCDVIAIPLIMLMALTGFRKYLHHKL